MSRSLSTRSAYEHRNSLLPNVAFEVIWECEVGGDLVRWDGNVESLFGYRRDEVDAHLGWWTARAHPEDLERVEAVAARAIRDGAPGWVCEYRFRRKDGAWVWLASRCAIERDAHGRAHRLVGAMIDVTKLKEAEARLHVFTRQIPARATATDLDLRVLWDTGAAFSETASAVGKTVPELFETSPDRERVLDACRRALSGESSVLDIDDGTAAARLHLGPFCDPAGDVTGVVGVAFDITDRVRSEAQVREGQRLLRQVLDTLPVGVLVLDPRGDITLGNSASERIWGGSIVRGTERWANTNAVWHGSGLPVTADQWASRRALDRGETTRDELIDIVTYSGQRKTIENYAAPILNAQNEITGAVVVNQDVTERVCAEDALRKLSRRLIEAQETERRAIARELHDDLGQVLTALRINMVTRHGDDAESLALVDGALARLRGLAQQLRPALLDEQGLAASLRWYVERESKRAGLEASLTVEAREPRPPVTLEVAVFRIVQEALTNVIRHAAATRVAISVSYSNDALHLIMRDDGRGFDVAAARKRATTGASQGLINMYERVALAGGELTIDSAPGEGTSVELRVPLVA